MVEVRDVQGADHYIRPLEGIGCPYWAGNPNPDRILFVKFVDADRPSRTHNVYVVEISGTMGSSFVATPAPTLRRSGNTRNSNTSLPAASETTEKRTSRTRWASSPRW